MDPSDDAPGVGVSTATLGDGVERPDFSSSPKPPNIGLAKLDFDIKRSCSEPCPLTTTKESVGHKISKPSSLTGESWTSTIPTISGTPLKKQITPTLAPLKLPLRRLHDLRRETVNLVQNHVNQETASERITKIGAQINIDDASISDLSCGERKRTKSLTEPISIFTSCFLPASCSPSPKSVDNTKQCFSPSTHQVVRNNITFSPSPTPSPTRRQSIMRSLSPIAVRSYSSLKRKFDTSGGDRESSLGLSSSQIFGYENEAKRLCKEGRRSFSPLIQESHWSSTDSSPRDQSFLMSTTSDTPRRFQPSSPGIHRSFMSSIYDSDSSNNSNTASSNTNSGIGREKLYLTESILEQKEKEDESGNNTIGDV